MSITRKSLAEEFEAQDLIVEAANRVKSDAMKAYKAQLAKDGWQKDDVKEEAEAFRKAFARFRAVTKHGSETVLEKEDRVEAIYAEITFVRATRDAHVEIIEEFDPATGEFKPQAKPVQTGPRFGSPTTNAGAVAVEAPAINPVANVEEGANGAIAAASDDPASREIDGADRQQPATSGFTGEGEAVAAVLPTDPQHEAEEAGEDVVTAASSPDTQSEPAEGSKTSAAPGDRGAVRPAAATVVAPFEVTYAEPGVVVMERCPPEGVVAHPFAACWPVNSIDVTDGVREPIVKQGKFILDGRGRYFAARDAGIEYPVVQYDGSDPLRDVIRWNLDSRKLSENQRRLIAQKLAKVEPGRADEVMQLFELHREAAE